jgi:hypothetical protein
MSSSSSGGGAFQPIDNISSGWTYLAMVRLGDNSDSGTVWEYCMGADTQTHCSTGHFVWDADISDGIDSKWVAVSLVVSTGDTTSNGDLTVGAAGAGYGQGAFSKITKVQIQASASGVDGSMQMQSISVEFMRLDGSGETVVIPQSSAPDGHNSTGSGTASQAIEVTPSGDSFVSVTINAQVRLTSPDTTLPGVNSLATGIYVFTA